jgi:alanyl-tRNA synthetase
MNLPPEKLYITVYKDDSEAYDIWKDIVDPSRIIPMGDDTNFWNMGPTGPCGPCSEILFDLGPEMSCGKPDCGPACSCNRYLEVWNLVFTQFDRQEDGSLKNLPRKNIDTGMGLERLVAVANGKNNVFDTDLFMPVIEWLADELNIEVKPNIGKLRMMADHTRAMTLLIGDGILPSNEGRGYVLRRILRRALRQGKLFGANKPFLFKATAVVAKNMQTAYPGLTEHHTHIASISKMEEEKFLETLESGTRLLDELIRKTTGSGTKTLSGAEVFKLYDTYGFPLDLTREIAGESGLLIDDAGFKSAQHDAQEKSRAAWSGSGDKDITFYSKLNRALGDTPFVGYEKTSTSAVITALIKNGAPAETLSTGDEGELVLDHSPFYAQSGGQVADTGTIRTIDTEAVVLDVQKPVGKIFVHRIKVLKGSLKTGLTVEAAIDIERRKNIMRHHTATHLLHAALRQIVGTHVVQAGSEVGPDGFRFDFTHQTALSSSELSSIEAMVNTAIRENMAVCVATMDVEQAKKTGAMALFNEKYDAQVRLVSVGDGYSKELCGGTHAERSGDIGIFKIVGESSVAAGTRRIEGVVGAAAENYIASKERLLKDASTVLKVSEKELASRIGKIIEHQKEMEHEIDRLKAKLASGSIDDIIKSARTVGSIKLVTGKIIDADTKTLRDLADSAKAKIVSGVVVMAGISGDKISFIVAVTKDIENAGFSAGTIARNFAKLIDGSGGGKADFAQGGGKNIAKIDEALHAIAENLK